MALYTPFDPSDFEAVSAAYRLGAVREAVGVPEGSINTNYRLETERGRFFLRHTTVRSADDLSFEAALLDHLQAAHFPSPVLEKTADGAPFLEHKGGRVSLFHYLAGQERTRSSLSADEVEHLGRELGKLHRLTLSFGGSRENPYSPAVVDGWLRELERHPDPELAKTARFLLGALEASQRFEPGLLPRGVIHADLFVDNVKWIGDRVSAFFDFEMACRDAYVLDLAITLNAWCFESGAYLPDHARALVRGYQDERKLSAEEREGLWSAALFGAVRFTTSRIRDFHLSKLPADRLAPKDFRTYLARARWLKERGPSGFRMLLGL